MTTNHREKLDPAILRPGRIDMQVELQNASEKQMVEMFQRFFPNNKDKAEEFAFELPPYTISMAKLQGHLMKYKKDASVCIENAYHLKESQDLVANDSFIFDWLYRLNLYHLKKKFEAIGANRMDDMKIFNDVEDFLQYEMTDVNENKRMWFMLTGKVENLAFYKYFN